jgi:hypothetical protein
MRTKEHQNGSKTKQSLHLPQVRGRGHIAVVEDTPVGADVTTMNSTRSNNKEFALIPHLKRQFIGIEKDPEIFQIARHKIFSMISSDQKSDQNSTGDITT